MFAHQMNFRYNVTVLEYKEGGKVPENMQSLDISMRFIKPENGLKADARSLSVLLSSAR